MRGAKESIRQNGEDLLGETHQTVLDMTASGRHQDAHSRPEETLAGTPVPDHVRLPGERITSRNIWMTTTAGDLHHQ